MRKRKSGSRRADGPQSGYTGKTGCLKTEKSDNYLEKYRLACLSHLPIEWLENTSFQDLTPPLHEISGCLRQQELSSILTIQSRNGMYF